ncbi:hypothetical protein [Curtobacterium sp. PhB136]|uniref:hypothetical protein n=1 Tax=Curtobacterium sp. PhB136 TaxID=2485181 RepID=UPI00104C613C|nr:hypothetical protein [Curtobacterium sp. PhB136]TCK65750.1 hypothetical protein EDF27_0491 [Curtobacterium sp. PhB136]
MNGKIRLSCPALGPAATVYCPIRDAHDRALRGKREPGQVHKQNLPKRWKDTPVCCQDSITIDPDDHVQEQQLFRYGSDEWVAVYRTDRNAIESTNDKLKSDFSLDLNTERRMRGLAAAQYVLGFKVAALNYKRIADYARDQIRKNERAKRAQREGIVTPIRPDVTTPATTTRKPADKKVRSRAATDGPTTDGTPRRSEASSPRPTQPTETQRAPGCCRGLFTLRHYANRMTPLREQPCGGSFADLVEARRCADSPSCGRSRGLRFPWACLDFPLLWRNP